MKISKKYKKNTQNKRRDWSYCFRRPWGREKRKTRGTRMACRTMCRRRRRRCDRQICDVDSQRCMRLERPESEAHARRSGRMWCGKGCYFWQLRFPFLSLFSPVSHFLPRTPPFPRLVSLLTGTHEMSTIQAAWSIQFSRHDNMLPFFPSENVDIAI